MIAPHGNQFVDRVISDDRSEELKETLTGLPSLHLDSDLFFDFSNIARGVYSPLEGFMARNDFLKVLNDCTLENGVAWPLPIVLDIGADLANEVEPGDRLGLYGPEDSKVGLIDVDSVYRYNQDETCIKLFGTDDPQHPGVQNIKAKGPFLIGGSIKAFSKSLPRNGRYDLSPREARVLFKNFGWETVVGFQTRNVPHRAHEYLQKSALEHVDGLFIQPKIGAKKAGDYTDEAILRGYEALIDHYYPSEAVVLSMFKSRMMYAGPREAIFDSIVRKNFGCTHFIIGRDHAGVGAYYDDFEAQRLFDVIGDIGIRPMYYHYAFYCSKCDGIVSEKVCPHSSDYHLEPSGTDMRQTLESGASPPPECMRPEVAETVLQLDEVFTAE